MYLKQLELSGFKSFAKKSVVEFKSPITAIVGPNGSGKSNIAEAFRFALGEQSVKSMRGKKSEDLIWNGSEDLARANRASVRASFDNSKRIFNIDFDEVSVERVVGRDGLSEYFLNGSQVRLRDTLEFLSQAHIGVSGHHIISQGEADRILSSNPKERKEMLEDALGLKLYQYKKRESQKKLLKTEENIEKVESLRREIAPHLRFLKKQVEKANKAEETRERLVAVAREYLKREKVYIDGEKEKFLKEKEPLAAELGKLEEEMKRAESEVEKSKAGDSKSEELVRLEGDIRKQRQEREEMEREIGRVEGEMAANRKIIEKEEEKNKNPEGKTILLSEVAALKEEVAREAEAAEGEADLNILRRIILSIREKLEKFIESRREHVGDHVADLRNQNGQLESRKKDIEAAIGEKSQNLGKLEEASEKLRREISKKTETLAEAEKRILIISGEESALRSKLDAIKSGEENLKTEENDFLSEAKNLGALLGESILGFENLAVEGEENQRQAQHERLREMEKYKVRLEEFGASGGADVLNEFRETSERDAFLEKELGDLHSSSESLDQLIKDLDAKLQTEFKEGVQKINGVFQNFFSLMFGGGNAKLEIVEKHKAQSAKEKSIGELEGDIENIEEEENEEGVEVSVSLPKKRIRGLDMLSGGERALTSIALLFAISQVNPPPFIVLDETDAALDEANSKKYGDMIENLSKFSQLILITHNRETMSRAGIIYGVTMGSSGVSKLLSIAFDEAVSVAK